MNQQECGCGIGSLGEVVLCEEHVRTWAIMDGDNQMKTKFEVGDHVAFYNHYGRRTGTIHSFMFDNQLMIRTENTDDVWTKAHEKQCRKLVKKKRREWWVKPQVDDITACLPYEPQDLRGWIKVVEVKE